MSSTNAVGFKTKRTEILQAYEAANRPFIARTMPHHSVQFLQFDAVSYDQAPSPGAGYLIARAGQLLNFFSYGIGDRIQVANTNVQFAATESETTLTKGKSTQGAADFVIEGLGISHRGTRIVWVDLDEVNADCLTHLLSTTTDSAIHGNALGQGGLFDGTKLIMDPGALIAPPQVHSPFNMEDALLQAVLPVLRINFEIDGAQSALAKLGPSDIMPQAGAASYLRTNGVPSTDNRFRIPEGILWRRDGETDSELIVKATLDRDVVFPLSGLVSPFNATKLLFPQTVVIDLSMRLYGLELRLPSTN